MQGKCSHSPLMMLHTYVIVFCTVPITVPPEINLESEAVSLDQYTPAFQLSDSSSATNGFTLIGKEGEPGISTNNMRVS